MRLPALLLAAPLALQAAAQAPVFRSGVELVEVAVLVRGRDGRLVSGLGQEDFEILERGSAQAIVAFDRIGYNQLDLMGSQQRYSSDVRQAINRSVGALIRRRSRSSTQRKR